MLKVEKYLMSKIKFYKQRLNALYGLTAVEKRYNYSKYKDLVKTDRESIRYHIEMIREVRECIKMK